MASDDADQLKQDAAEFHRAMVKLYQNAKRQAGYNATYFLRMVSEEGGLSTAHTLIAASQTSAGFTALYERGRLDLTVEALVLEPRFASLFSAEEREIATDRLLRHGYTAVAGNSSEGPGQSTGPTEEPAPPASHPDTYQQDRLSGETPAVDSAVRTPPPPTTSPPQDSVTAAGRNRIFLCHSHGDKGAVRSLYHRLRTDGFHPWLDEEDIYPGEDWQLEIRKAMRSSRVILACLSGTSTTKSGFVQREIKDALELADEQPEGSIFLIPIRMEECTVPEQLSRRQWVDLYAPGQYDRLLATLRRTNC